MTDGTTFATNTTSGVLGWALSTAAPSVKLSHSSALDRHALRAAVASGVGGEVEKLCTVGCNGSVSVGLLAHVYSVKARRGDGRSWSSVVGIFDPVNYPSPFQEIIRGIMETCRSNTE